MSDITRGQTLKTGIPKDLKKNLRSPDVFAPKGHPLESNEAQEKLNKLMQWRRQARIAQAPNRQEMAIDEDFYDGAQLDDRDLKILQDRNQPPLVFNVVANTVNWILGTERRARIDSRVLPRKQAGAQNAKAKTKLMKFTLDCSKGEYERSFAFEGCVKAGMGWLETGARQSGEEPVFVKHESWRNMWFDHLGASIDGSDWRYVIREKWIDMDIAIAMFPGREGAIKQVSEAVNSKYPYLPDDIAIADPASEFDLESEIDSLFGGRTSGARERIKMVEMWYRQPANVKLLRKRGEDTPYGALDGAIFRPDNADHQYLVRGNYFTLTDALTMVVRNAMWTGTVFLQDIMTPYNHNRFTFTPLFCYRRSRDGMPYGVIRNLRDPQCDLNKRRSKALVLLTANKVIMEKGAVDNKEEAYDEMNRPDGMVEVNVGKRFEKVEERDLAAAHVELARDDERFIANISGVTPEVRGDSKRDLSGVAVKALQNQGQVTQGVYFDNLYYAIQNEGEIRLSLIEQYFDQEKEYRITGDRHKDEFIKINEQKPDGKIENDILRTKEDFIIGKQDFRETIRLSMVETLTELVTSLAQSMPEVALNLIDMVIDLMDDVPNKDEIVARIRKINGQTGPEDELTPEQKDEMAAQQEAMAQKQQQAEQVQQAMMQLQMATQQAEATGKMAKAERDKMETAMKKIETFLKTLEVAGTLQAAPQLAAAADELFKEASSAPTQDNAGGIQQ
jgi:hypothetical protein